MNIQTHAGHNRWHTEWVRNDILSLVPLFFGTCVSKVDKPVFGKHLQQSSYSYTSFSCSRKKKFSGLDGHRCLFLEVIHLPSNIANKIAPPTNYYLPVNINV